MFKFYPIYRRELKSYIISPSLYASAALWFFMTGMVFFMMMAQFSEASTNATVRREWGIDKLNYTVHVAGAFFRGIHMLLIFVVPLFTMRLLAEEKRTGTFELLKSLPFTDHSVVTGKFLAAYTLIALLVLGNAAHIASMFLFGRPEMNVLFVAFGGLLLASAAYVSIGLFCSALSDNQIVAAIASFVILMALFFVGQDSGGTSSGLPRILEVISLEYHTDQMNRGLLRLEDIAYFALLIVTFLFLTCRVLELRRWKV